MKEKGHHRFDCQKALTATHTHYFLRLGIAINDLLSAIQLLNLKTDHLPEHTRKGLQGYLLKLQVCHLVEAYEAFVVRIANNNKNKDLIDFLNLDSKLGQTFKDLDAMRTTDAYKSIEKFRHNFGFHYNYSEKGTATMNAFKSILNSSDGSNPDHGLIIHTSNYNTDRFCFADAIVTEGWLNFAGIDDSTPPEDVAAYRESIGKATALFLRFAQDAILHWVQQNNLQYKYS